MNDAANKNDSAYVAILEQIHRDEGARMSPRVIDELRRLASSGHAESMNLLAVILGDVGGVQHKEEIVGLYTESHNLGSPVAAENLAMQYRQWNEPLLAGIWARRAKERVRSLS